MVEDKEERIETLQDRVDELEATVSKMLPSRRDALKLGAAGAVGAVGMAGSASAQNSNQVGTIGTDSDRVDVNAEDIDAVSVNTDGINRAKVGTKIYDSDRTTYFEGTPKVVPFDSSDYDFENGADLANNRIVVPEDGTYSIIFNFAARSDLDAGANVIVRYQLNGTSVQSNEIQVANSDFLFETLVLKDDLRAGDAVSIELEYTSAGGSGSFSGNDGEHGMSLAVTGDR